MACLTLWDKPTARVFDTDGPFHALFANSEKSGLARDAVLTIRRRKRASSRVAGGCRGGEVDVSVSCQPPRCHDDGLTTVAYCKETHNQ